jgi:PHD finger protein
MTFNVGFIQEYVSDPTPCQLCGTVHDTGLILRCQGCARARHTDCVNKSLTAARQANLPPADA